MPENWKSICSISYFDGSAAAVFRSQEAEDDQFVWLVLQDLVEIIMGLQRSLSCAGHSVSLSEGSTVSSLLCQYASLLAAQGVLRTAVSYLNSATQVSEHSPHLMKSTFDARSHLTQCMGENYHPHFSCIQYVFSVEALDSTLFFHLKFSFTFSK